MRTIYLLGLAISTIFSFGCARNAPSANSPVTNVHVGQAAVVARHQPTTTDSVQTVLPVSTPSTDTVSHTSSDVDAMLGMMATAKAPTKAPLIPAGL